MSPSKVQLGSCPSTLSKLPCHMYASLDPTHSLQQQHATDDCWPRRARGDVLVDMMATCPRILALHPAVRPLALFAVAHAHECLCPAVCRFGSTESSPRRHYRRGMRFSCLALGRWLVPAYSHCLCCSVLTVCSTSTASLSARLFNEHP